MYLRFWELMILGPAALTKIYAKCYPMQHFSVPRDLRRIIKDRFDREGIEIPYTQVDVHITNDKGYPEG